NAGCTLQLDAAGVADRHARLSMHDDGSVWLENFEADAFTMYNGQRLTSRQQLAEGDRIEIGLASLTFRAHAQATGPAPLPAVKLGGSDRTMMGADMPPELK